MATGTTLFTRSLRMLGALSSGASPNANQLADGLVAINGLIESWRNDRLLVYSKFDLTINLVPAQQSYSIEIIGTDGNPTRPVKFDDAYMRQSNTDTPVRLIDQDEWDSIPTKNVTSPIVQFAYYSPTMPDGTLLVYPVPSASNVLHMTAWTILGSLAAMSDTVSLPPGYNRMISANLAIEIAPEYGTSASPELVKIARDSMAAIKRINTRIIPAFSDIPTARKSRAANILIGP